MIYYKCEDCGQEFELENAKTVIEMHGFERGNGDEVALCPNCGGAYFSKIEFDVCECCNKRCGATYCGLCEDCLVKMINYENALDFFEETNNLAYFIFDRFYNMDYPKSTTKEFDEELRMIFLRKKVEDLYMSKTDLLNMIVDFIKEDELSNFSEFLKERGDI